MVRSSSEVSGGQSIQFLGENIDRARDHLRQALGFLEQLWVSGLDHPLIVGLQADLRSARVDEVLPRLAHSAIPSDSGQAAAYLSEVSAQIRGCAQLVNKARNLMTLEHVRDTE
jgi:hypothetical protein